MPHVIRHISINCEGMLRNYEGKSMQGFFDINGRPATDDEVREYLNDCLAKGWKKIPGGDCEGFDHFGGGCPGHPVDEVEEEESTKYYIVCMAHTHKRDKYITLWGPNNAGYHYSREMSGLYDVPEKGYHDSEINLPITQALAESLFTCVTYEGKRKHMILNNSHSWNRLGLAWHKGTLIRIAAPEAVEEKIMPAIG